MIYLTFDGQFLSLPSLLVSAEAPDVADTDHVVIDVEAKWVELKELNPELGSGAVVSNFDAGQVFDGTWNKLECFMSVKRILWYDIMK